MIQKLVCHPNQVLNRHDFVSFLYKNLDKQPSSPGVLVAKQLP